MIVQKIWYNQKYDKGLNRTILFEYNGWFLFGIIPLKISCIKYSIVPK
jgi:hypothetical protein